MFNIFSSLETIILLVCILMAVAFLTVAERKTMGYMQRRLGPNVVGYYGLLQAFADALKLLIKEIVLPTHSYKLVLILAPYLSLTIALLNWAIIPFGANKMIYSIDYSILYALSIGSLGVLGIMFAGWSSHNKYGMIGAIRSGSQMISYELVLTSVSILIMIIAYSLDFQNVILMQTNAWFITPLFFLFIIYVIGCLAENNRPPFDLPEAESELVAGFMTEHSAGPFVFFFLAEYSNMLFTGIMISMTFLGGYNSFVTLPIPDMAYTYLINDTNSILLSNIISPLMITLKGVGFTFIYIWIRASFPRFRFDQLMKLCWLVFLPLLLMGMILLPAILFTNNAILLPTPGITGF